MERRRSSYASVAAGTASSSGAGANTGTAGNSSPTNPGASPPPQRAGAFAHLMNPPTSTSSPTSSVLPSYSALVAQHTDGLSYSNLSSPFSPPVMTPSTGNTLGERERERDRERERQGEREAHPLEFYQRALIQAERRGPFPQQHNTLGAGGGTGSVQTAPGLIRPGSGSGATPSRFTPSGLGTGAIPSASTIPNYSTRSMASGTANPSFGSGSVPLGTGAAAFSSGNTPSGSAASGFPAANSSGPGLSSSWTPKPNTYGLPPHWTHVAANMWHGPGPNGGNSIGSNGLGLDNGPVLLQPSHLRGTSYMSRLEEAHRKRVEAWKKEFLKPPPTTLGAGAGHGGSISGSLSTSSSSVSLHRMAPSHRGMTYEIVESHPPSSSTVPIESIHTPPLPSRWVEVDRFGGLEILSDGRDLKFSGLVKSHEHEAAAARTDHPMPPQCGIYYYEVTILGKGKEGMIGVGFAGAKASLEKLPGWEPESWAYHGDDGKTFCCQSTGKPYGPTFTTGDVIGCGVNFRSGTGFFTKNGVFLGYAFRDLKDLKIFPSIGMKRPGAHVSVNFGQQSFMYDIDGMVKTELVWLHDEINQTDVTFFLPNTTEQELLKDLIAQFLRHDGYIAAANSFAHERQTETSALRGTEGSTDQSDIQQDADAVNRQQIRAAILNGDIDAALKRTQTAYPNVLRDYPRIYFRLRCRKFVEMMRQPASPPIRSRSISNIKGKTLASATKLNPPMSSSLGTQSSDDVFEQDMELDDEPATMMASTRPVSQSKAALGQSTGDDWDRMDTEDLGDGRSASGTGGPIQDPMVDALQYAQELRLEYRDDKSREVREALQEIFALFAYEDPRNSPTAAVMDSRGRVTVAEELNSAILVSQGKSSTTALETVYQQTEVLINDISDHGGAGAFVNVRDDFLPA